jgi:hypothetical protein
MISTSGAMHSWIPLWASLVSINGVMFTMTDGTMHFTLNLDEVTGTIHIIVVTLLHIVHLVMEVLLLSPPLPHLSHGHIRYIVEPVIQGPL